MIEHPTENDLPEAKNEQTQAQELHQKVNELIDAIPQFPVSTEL